MGGKKDGGRREVVVLRYGHRIVRDFRVTSHCCLAARAFGADKIIIEGDAGGVKKSVDGVVDRWGGDFEVGSTDSWKRALGVHREQGFKSVHLTMYGQPLAQEIGKLRKHKKLLVVIGSQKVEKAVYETSDFNVSVGLTPHSEISALAVFLHELFRGKELGREFKGAMARIVPQPRGKKVVKSDG